MDPQPLTDNTPVNPYPPVEPAYDPNPAPAYQSPVEPNPVASSQPTYEAQPPELYQPDTSLPPASVDPTAAALPPLSTVASEDPAPLPSPSAMPDNIVPAAIQPPAPLSSAPLPATPPVPGDPNLAPGSQEILVIRRHPFGLVGIFLEAIFGVGIALGLLLFLVPAVLSGTLRTQAFNFLLILSVVVVAIVALILIAATYVYRQNRWIVTGDSVHQVLQRGLFSRQTSELSMANIEDVTADQRGILAELFHFGTLKAETAGELPYFHFNYCPTPEKYARIILNAREQFINTSPEEAKRANDLLNVPGVRR